MIINSMELYLLRHGIAEDRAPSGRDADRRLTEEGRDKLRRILERAHSAGAQPSVSDRQGQVLHVRYNLA